jgi:putative PEP-CTERM system integral membrane protein
MNQNENKTRIKDILAYGLFWSWNIIFLAFMVLGFAPRLLPELMAEVRDGVIPLSYLIYAVVLTCVPLAAVALGLTLLRRAPTRLFALGYVVEGPLMLLLAVRFFLIRQGTPAMTFILAVAGLGMAAFLWHVLDPPRRGGLGGSLRLAGMTLMLLTSLYASLWIVFYALPISAYALAWLARTAADIPGFLRGISVAIDDLIKSGWAWIPFSVTSFLLILYTATLFVLAPIAVPVLSLRAWRRCLSALVQNGGRIVASLVVASTVIIVGVLAVVTNRQPQMQAFALLEKPPESVEEAEALLARQESIRAGLLNAYLAPFRYLSALGEVRHVSDLYQDAFKLSAVQAYQVQRVYEGVARPLLYVPANPGPVGSVPSALQREPQEAAVLYQRFFDTPLVEAERQVVVDAVRSTWSADQAESAWQAIDDREVLLLRQEITVQEHSDWAEVEIMEAYQNRTFQNQEVIYYFNLPESAVITGLWLGNSPERQARFVYQVAPRGAAQAVYREQTRVIRDPALLEQVGPRQYRLRAFPVPPKSARWIDENTRRVVEEARPLYLWMTYRLMAD